MAQNASAPAMLRMQPDTLTRSFDMRISPFGGIVVEGNPGVGDVPQVVVLAGEQPAAQDVVLAHQRPGARLGFPVPVTELDHDRRFADGGLWR